MTYREIEQKLGASAPTVSKWKTRFEQHGVEGLQARHQGSKPRRATPAVQARIIRRAQQKPADGSTHWSCRKLAGELGIRKRTLRIWEHCLIKWEFRVCSGSVLPAGGMRQCRGCRITNSIGAFSEWRLPGLST